MQHIFPRTRLRRTPAGPNVILGLQRADGKLEIDVGICTGNSDAEF
jgi:hypothetical protein